MLEVGIVRLLQLCVHCHLVDPADLFQEILLAEAVLFLKLAVAARIKLRGVEYLALATVLAVFEDGVENALADEEEANDLLGIGVIDAVDLEARAVVCDVYELDDSVPGEGEDWHGLVAVARRQPISPVDVGQRCRPAKLRPVYRINAADRIHRAYINHVQGSEGDYDAVVAKLIWIERVRLLYRYACRSLHFAFEEVLLLHRVAAEQRLLAYLDQSDAALVLRAHGVYHAVIFGSVVYLHVGHVALVDLWHMLQESVFAQVPECD